MFRYQQLLLLLLLILIGSSSFAKVRPFYGRIINEAGQGLPMSTVESKDRKYIFYANAKGVFSFKADEDSIDFFIFSAQGYDKRDFLVEDLPEDSIIIELKKRENNLRGAVISAKGKKLNIATSGISGGAHSTNCYLNIYDEVAIFLGADDKLGGNLKEVGAYITKGGIVSNDFKMHIYARDSTAGAPANEITDSILIMRARKGNEWVTADLTKKFIQVHGGVFVSVEWIVGAQNDFFAWPIPDGNSNYYAGNDSLRHTFNGQVLGLAWQDSEPEVYRRYASNKYGHKDEGKWYKTAPLVGGHKGRGWITPMIYYTYSYIDK